MVSALGKNGQILNVVPSQNLVMVRMGNDPGSGNALISATFNDTIWKYFTPIQCNSTAINDEVKEKTIEIFPNPAKDVINITRETNHPVNYVIRALNGTVVKKGQTITSIKTDDLNAGSYSLSLQLNKQTIINKRFILIQ